MFDDATLTKDFKKQNFEAAWMLAGPIYCNKYGLHFVPHNKAEAQKKEGETSPIHYIFALDDSGSMGGTPWNNLINSFKQTIEKIKAKDTRNKTKVSLIVFGHQARLIC